MTPRHIEWLTTLALLLLGGWLLLAWQSQAPRAGIVYSQPGLDGAPAGRGKPKEGVVIGEKFARLAEAKPSPLPGSWPSFRGAAGDNICRDGVALANQWPAAGPRVLWRQTLGEGHSGAVIRQGRVFVLDYLEEAEADALRCFDLESGTELWRRWYKVPVKRNHGKSRTVPAVSDRLLVSIGPKCHVMCLRPDSGDLLWTIDLVKEYGSTIPQWYTGQCPLIDDGTVVLAPAGTADLMIGVEGETGKVLWRVPNEGKWEMSHASVMAMTLAGKRMYVYPALGGVVGVSAEEADRGRVLWRHTGWKPSVVAPSAVAMGEELLFLTAGYGAGSAVLEVQRDGDRFSVRELAQYKPKDGLALEQQSAIFWQGYLWGILPKDAGANRQLLAACRPESATRLELVSHRDTRFGLGPFLVADNKIFVLNDDGTLSMLALDNGMIKKLAEHQVFSGADAWAPLAIADGRMVLRDSREMACLDLRPAGKEQPTAGTPP